VSHIANAAKGFEWIHVDEVGEADFAYLEERFKFHPLDYADVRSDAIMSKMDTYKHYVFLVFQIPIERRVDQPLDDLVLYVFLSEQAVVTITREPSAVLQRIAERLAQNPRARASMIGKGTGLTLYRLLSEAFHQTNDLVARLGVRVRELESAVYISHHRNTTIALAKARRDVLFLRHLIDPQRHLLSSLVNLRRPYLPEELSAYLDDLGDTLDMAYLTIDNLKSIIDGLFEVNESLLTHQTNRVITLLTVISAALMAPTLVAGFYGMNVPWLPLTHDSWFVSSLFVVSILLVLISVHLITRRRV
jgi:magnesium transporter